MVGFLFCFVLFCFVLFWGSLKFYHLNKQSQSTQDFELEIILQLYWDVKWELCVDYFNSTFLENLLLKPPEVNEYIQVPHSKVGSNSPVGNFQKHFNSRGNIRRFSSKSELLF